ncbi:Flagellar hook-length control protein FliK [Botrimarina colliarenosi]|uniref:Flagellar hook-length control protein FliK n=1 Tax=Botrimarina colliarenosi TaxID=2528001 RepID=A0A5C6ALI9_9BACT|nr:flagellar hook-length control protein FliK [Botrimarina colliarenosi]TWU00327.1 Flagellar hook-length control protein FliK [Botrimarina colliarenosi]
MNDSIHSAPSLLTLTAPAPARRESSGGASDSFGDRLNEAVNASDAPPPAAETTPKASENANPDAKDDKTVAQDASDASETSTEVAAESTETDSTADDPTPDELGEIDPVEAALLSTYIVTETIVLETGPDVVLPDEAATSIDVSAAADGIEGIDPALPPTQPVANTPAVASPSPATDGASAAEGGESGDLLPAALTDSDASADASLDTTIETTVEATTTTDEGAVAIAVDPVDDTQAETAAAGALTNQPTVTDQASEASDEASSTEQAAADGDAADEEARPGPSPATVSAATAPTATVTHRHSDDDKSADAQGVDSATPASREGGERRNGAAVESADKANPLDRTPTIDPARFVSRVTRAIDMAQQRGGGPVEMRLSPPELGALQVKIEVKEGVMTAKMEVETPAARNALLDNLPALRERLDQQNIRIDKFDVEVRDEAQQRGGDWRQQQDNQQRSEERQNRPAARPAAPAKLSGGETSGATASPRTITFTNNGINLVV